MSRADRQFNLRLPRELHEEIQAAAKANARSMNAEIVLRLQQPPAAIADDLADIKYSLARLVQRADAEDFSASAGSSTS